MATTLPGQNSLKRAKAIWQIGLVIFIAVAIPLTVGILRYVIDFRSSADPTEEPREVVISNLTDQGAVISFETPDSKTKSTIKYGVSEDLNGVSFDSRYQENKDNLFNLHHHQLTKLVAETEYTFTITVGQKSYTSENFKFKTLKVGSGVGTPDPIKGKVSSTNGNITEGIIYANLSNGAEDSTIISNLLPTSGNYTLDLTIAKDASGSKFSQADTVKLYVFANAADKGEGFVSSAVKVDNLPDIHLAQEDIDYTPGLLRQLSTQDNSVEPTPTATPTPIPTEDDDKEPTSTPKATTPPSGATSTPTPVVTDEPSPPSNTENDSVLIDSGYDTSESLTDPTAPYNILVSNLDSKTFTVTWLTKEPTGGTLVYGINAEPNKETKDNRDPWTDPVQHGSPRYSHYVNINDEDITANTPVQFRVVVTDYSDSGNPIKKEYKQGETNFQIITPATPPSPPSPTSQDGALDPTFTEESAADDFIVLARVPGETTWISAPASRTRTWNLPLGTLREEGSSSYATTPESLAIEIYGSNNSAEVTTVTVDDEVNTLEVEPGIIVDINNNQQIKIGESITGSAKPNESVNVTIGETSTEIRANSQGRWEYQIPPNAPTGEQSAKFSNQDTTIPYRITLSKTVPTPTPTKAVVKTPDTAIEDYFFLLPGMLILLIGFTLIPMGIKQDDDQIELD